ncbi:MAG: metalloprotease PmbA [Gammaproteobacteria bacterium]|nr:metalloprotease PmbA [Gammaproteobacteria bacterium]
MTTDITKSRPRPEDANDADRLAGLAAQVLELAAARGATQAEVSISEDSGLAVYVRMGEVETVERTRDRGVSLTVYFGQRKASASTADLQPASLLATVEQACAIAKFTEADSAAGLADAGLMAREIGDFDQWHPWDIDAERAIALAIAAEARGRDTDPRISNSDGSAVNTSTSIATYANSHGFIGFERSTSHSISCSLIAGRDDGMQRDYWYTAGLSADDLETPAQVGRRAAERTVARLDPRPIRTGDFPVLFSPEMSRSLVGHLLGAVSGGALYRRASFLLDSVGTRLFPEWFSIVEDPFVPRGFRSASFDAEGVATRHQDLVRDGVLQRYVLGSYSARKLGLATTANAGGVHNLQVASNAVDADSIMRQMGTGLLVTELMGQGVNTITGDYSRGAAGFWIEGGEVRHAVDEITIAGNLRDMFQAIEAVGADIDRRSHISIGSVLVGKMMVAGES